MVETNYEWEVVDANWSRCKKTSLWLSTPTQWLYAFEEGTNTFKPLEAFKPKLSLPYEAKGVTVVCGGATMQGRRPAQEDRFGVYKDLSMAAEPSTERKGQHLRTSALELDCPRLLALVCDGHAGPQAADFVMESLPFRIGQAISETFSEIRSKRGVEESGASPRKKRPRLAEDESQVANGQDSTSTSSSPRSRENVSETTDNCQPTPEEISEALVRAFETVDREFLLEYRTSRDGSTATAGVVVNNHFFVANCGDSRAVMGIKSATDSCWNAVRTSVDHKPDLPTEKARIDAKGGIVRLTGFCARVMQADYSTALSDQKRASLNGEGAKGRVPLALAVSRAFGDRQLKVNGVMVATPDVQVHHLTPDYRACVICSDGVWDVLSDVAAIRIAEWFYPDKPQEAASTMIRKAYGGRSMDNITCVVIYFKWKAETPELAPPLEAQTTVATEELPATLPSSPTTKDHTKEPSEKHAEEKEA